MISVKAILTDIEGTTTDIAFVHKVLFPYARERMNEFVRARAGDAYVAEQLAAVAKEVGRELSLDEGIAQLVAWIDADKKIAPLKNLQGIIWQQGYAAQHFSGHVYPDAVQALRLWHDKGKKLYVYSSGSVQAQQLIFGHTPYGDMTPLFSGYYDTRVGGKREAASYIRIAGEMALKPKDILFLSDITEELDAAREAGMQTIQLVREGELSPASPHPQVRSFDAIQIGGRRSALKARMAEGVTGLLGRG